MFRCNLSAADRSRIRYSASVRLILDRILTAEYAMGRALNLSPLEISRNVDAVRDDFWAIAESTVGQ